MNNDFYILNHMFARRRKRLHQIALQQIDEGDYGVRSEETLQQISLAIDANNKTDEELLERYV